MKDLPQLALRLDLRSAGRAVHEIAAAILSERELFVAGIGGSAGTATHIVRDLIGTARAVGYPGARVIGLADDVAWAGVANSALEKRCDACLSVESDDYGLAEDQHLALNHVVSRVIALVGECGKNMLADRQTHLVRVSSSNSRLTEDHQIPPHHTVA